MAVEEERGRRKGGNPHTRKYYHFSVRCLSFRLRGGIFKQAIPWPTAATSQDKCLFEHAGKRKGFCPEPQKNSLELREELRSPLRGSQLFRALPPDFAEAFN